MGNRFCGPNFANETHRGFEPERDESEHLHIEIDLVQDEKQDGVSDDEDRRRLEERAERRPLPEIAWPRREGRAPVGGAVQDADVEETVLGDDHEDRLDEQVGLEPGADPVKEAGDVGNDKDPGHVGAEPSRVVLLADRDVLPAPAKGPNREAFHAREQEQA